MTLLRVNDEGMAVEDVSDLFLDADTAMKSYGGSILVLDAPSEVRVGWTFDGRDWHEPSVEGRAYDVETDSLIPHDRYRIILHQRTDNDVMEALRKLREGDRTIDWQAWLDALDAYNMAIEKTKEQEGYPLRVTYPEYPTKPTA